VADWVCPAGTGAGYPEFAYRRDVEHGYKNLAVFYHACSFDCLFCQNWHYRQLVSRQGWVRASELAEAVAFLASEEARYITGQVLNVDGGMAGAWL